VRSRLQLGLIPLGGDVGQKATAFANALGSALGGTVELHNGVDYRAIVAGMEQGLVDFAWLPPLSAARVVRAGAGVAAAVAVRNGTTSYMTGLMAMKTSPIRSLADLLGVRAAWVDRESASGYVLIRAALKQAGVSLVDAFSEELFVRSHAEVARALQSGRADVGATCFNAAGGEVEIARLPAGDGLASSEVRILAQAGPIPSDIFAVRTEVAVSALPAVQAALVDARPGDVHRAAKDLMQADGFVRPALAHTQMIESLYELLDAPPSRRTAPPPPPRE
jgi:phosphonate transport system substrate-binding protein